MIRDQFSFSILRLWELFSYNIIIATRFSNDMKKPTITLDTNSIIDLERGTDEDLAQLYSWHKSGKIVIVKTDVVDTEMGNNPVSKSQEFSEDQGDGVVGHSRIGHAKIG
jgi:hypothetical protein